MKFFCLLILPIVFATCEARAVCLDYTDKVTLEGKISAADMPGPPNYESVAEGDRSEHDLFIELSAPVCVDADIRKQTAGINGAALGIAKLQITAEPRLYKSIDKLVGHKVRITGKLFGMWSAHHHTPILIDADTAIRE